MKILVTGATGFFGGHVCEYFKNKGEEVVGLIRNPKKANFLEKNNIPFIVADLTNKQDIIKGIKDQNFDIVIHTAGFVSDRGSLNKFKKGNIETTINIAEAMEKLNIPRLIHISSLAIFGAQEIVNITEDMKKIKKKWFKYGYTKLLAEEAVSKFQSIKTTILRPGHIIGRRDRRGFIPIIYHMLRKELPFINDGRTIQPLVYVGDVLQAIDLSIKNEVSIGEAFNVVGDEPVTIQNIEMMIHEKMGVPLHNSSKSFKIAFLLASLFEFLHKFGLKPPMTRMSVIITGKNFFANNDKLKKELNWLPQKNVDEMVSEWCIWRKKYEQSNGKS